MLPRTRRPPRLPRPAPPDAIAIDFGRRIAAFFVAWANDLFAVLRATESRGVRLDARVPDGWQRRVRLVTQERFRSRELEEIVEGASRAVVRKPPQRGDWIDRVARVNSIAEAATAQQAYQWQRANLERIVSLTTDVVDKIEPLVTDAINRGLTTEALQRQIQDTIGEPGSGVTWQAERIARDQVLSFNAEIRETRQRALGVREFVWRTSQDQRVRESHAELDGETFSYDDPPIVDGEPTLPGEAILCRCTAEAVVPDDLAEIFE